MEIIPFIGGLKKLQWKRRGYNKLSPNQRNLKVARFGKGNSKRTYWRRLRLAPKLRIVRFVSPLKLWYKLKNTYVNIMLKLANSSGTSNSGNLFGTKRIPKGREVPMAYSRTEFENRLIFEIYKNLVPAYELGYIK